ncbi:MAG TPA: TetR/AcrR family transcriptional regulator [Azospirillaceae bacterium]|nr:TetR/AcrR family transcriptional regulator [Azospirillaceae bacterium]
MGGGERQEIAARRTRLPAAERREQILRIARELFIAEGFERASMRRIAERAGITPTAIYDHFADKEALMAAIGEEFFDGLIEALSTVPDATPDPLDRLKMLLEGYVRYGLARPREYRLVFMTPLEGLGRITGHRLPRDGTPPECLGGTMKGAISFAVLEGEIGMLMERGVLRPGDKEAVADVVWMMGHGLVSLLITHPGFEWTPLDTVIRTSIDTLLHGIVADLPPRHP